MIIEDNIVNIRSRIVKAAEKAKRPASEILLVCVTKKASIEDVVLALNCGITDVGENTVQSALFKHENFKKSLLRWHFIGHLQTNKVKDAVRVFDLIHSVDSERLSLEIDRQARKINKIQKILLQINISGEKAKYGLCPDKAGDLVKRISLMKNVMTLGLMTIAPYSENKEDSREHYRNLRNLMDSLKPLNSANIDMRHLSMGMSGDFEVAIEEGADILRIGTAIFSV